jgi:hypothetical protein
MSRKQIKTENVDVLKAQLQEALDVIAKNEYFNEERLKQLDIFEHYKGKVGALERELDKYKAMKLKWYKKYKDVKPGVAEADEDDLDIYMGAMSIDGSKDAKQQLKQLQERYDKLFEESGDYEAYKLQCRKYEIEIGELKKNLDEAYVKWGQSTELNRTINKDNIILKTKLNELKVKYSELEDQNAKKVVKELKESQVKCNEEIEAFYNQYIGSKKGQEWLKKYKAEQKKQDDIQEYNDGDTAPATQEDNYEDAIEMPPTQVYEDKLTIKVPVIIESDDDTKIDIPSSQESMPGSQSTRPKRTNSKTKEITKYL